MLLTRASTKKIFLFGLLAILSVGHAFAILAPPVITSFSPASGPVGTLVTINGTNLASPTTLTIGGQTAIVISNTGSVLVAMVMPNAATGTVALTTADGTATGGSFTVTPTLYPYSQQGARQVGTGSTGTGNAGQGSSIAVSADGNTALVGGPFDNLNLGAVWVFTRTGGIWAQQGIKLAGTGGTAIAQQGFSAALSADGNTAIFGGVIDNGNRGAAWVYTRSGSTWTQQIRLSGSGPTGFAQQGVSVSISADGNTAMVGGYQDNSQQGAVWMYTRSGGSWAQQGTKLLASDATSNALQGISVSLSADGNTAIVGGSGDNSGAGAVWVYTRNGNSWVQQGAKLVGTGAIGAAQQGRSVSLSADGNTAMVGGLTDNTNQGAVWVFTRSGGIWAQQGTKLVGTGGLGANPFQGQSVSVSADGNTAMVSGYADNSGAGAVWIYTRSGGVWTQQGNKLVGTGATGTAQQGYSGAMSADGNTAVVGAPFDTGTQGAMWVYSSAPTIQATYLTFTNTTTTTTTASWINGNGVSRAVFVSQAASGGPEPGDGTSYIAGTLYGTGTQVGSSGWYCVYTGTGTTVNITGLAAGTTYRVMAVEYNGTAITSKYLTTAGTGNPASIYTNYQGLTKNGNSATVGTTFVNANGKISAAATLTKSGQIVICPTNLIITHTSGTVAPATVTISYGVVQTGLSGATKCWITRNLGAAVQATSATDATNAAAGWYWQFNRMRGYVLNDDMITINPSWSIAVISENNAWLAANDPCTLQLGAGWRIPTATEWTAVRAGWGANADAYASVLKIHAAGHISTVAIAGNATVSSRGVISDYWSATQSSNINASSIGNTTVVNIEKTTGMPLRCLRD